MSFYYGDRPNLCWPKFLLHLKRKGHLEKKLNHGDKIGPWIVKENNITEQDLKFFKAHEDIRRLFIRQEQGTNGTAMGAGKNCPKPSERNDGPSGNLNCNRRVINARKNKTNR